MNKTDKLWVALLVLALAGYMGWMYFKPTPLAPQVPVVQSVPTLAPAPATSIRAQAAAPVQTPPTAASTLRSAKQTLYTLSNEQVKLTFSDLGARLTQAELLLYATENTETSSHVLLETGDLLNLSFGKDSPAVSYTATKKSDTELVFTGTVLDTTLVRTVKLEPDYRITVKDVFVSPEAKALPAYTLDAGSFALSGEKSDTLSIDTLALGERKPTYREGKLGKMLGAKSSFMGCGTSSDAFGLPLTAQEDVPGAQAWVALKSRFFTSLVMPPIAVPTTLSVGRDPLTKALTVNAIGATFAYPALNLLPGAQTIVTTRLYVGPKKLEYLKLFGAQAGDVMDFGFFSWFCALLLPILNFFYSYIPNYGVAIILLTILVRIVFWPLTHKSTVSMRKMSVIQPQIKELQKKFKDQPQKIQQETFKLYRENKVNPFSSCLPMLIQIPIFIALFTVLRSAVELRFASFLWIGDLSQPENLFAAYLPVPLNILPILTSVTMALQTHLSPSTGDPAQKKMMTWMMPIMLLFMFYSMPSALCLYWTVSQVLSIFQMWQIQRSTARQQAKA
ncbi:MAG: membrane protein insertase YidC [Kiritimatiellia bacterium]